MESLRLEEELDALSIMNYQVKENILPTSRVFSREYLSFPFYARNQESDRLLDYIKDDAPIHEKKEVLMNQVYHSINEFISKYGIHPNSIFLNRDAIWKLTSSNRELFEIRDGNMTYFYGLRIIETHLDNIFVGLSILE